MPSFSHHRRLGVLVLALWSLLVLVAAGPALATHDVPFSAGTTTTPDSPFQVPLVQEYKQCGTPGNPSNTTEGTPLVFPACAPPSLIGGALARMGPTSIANYKGTIVSGDELIVFSVNDVFNNNLLTDYTNSLTLITKLRIADHGCMPAPNTTPCTKVDIELPITVPCAATAPPVTGSTCSINTSFNAVIPGALVAGRQMVIDVFRVHVKNAGANGVAGDSDDKPFLMQGVYFP